MRNHTIAEIRAARPQFFKNAEGPERYRVRQNHLIVERLDTGRINVWQLIRPEGVYRLRPVWHVSEDWSLEQTLYAVECKLARGLWPVAENKGVDSSTGEAYSYGND